MSARKASNQSQLLARLPHQDSYISSHSSKSNCHNHKVHSSRYQDCHSIPPSRLRRVDAPSKFRRSVSLAMCSTTLTTFLLYVSSSIPIESRTELSPSQVHPSIVTVELLGSWDSFSRPYPLERDRRVGRGHWRGCHTFRNITCDGGGVSIDGRDGGLRMGGTYWYYVSFRPSSAHLNHLG